MAMNNSCRSNFLGICSGVDFITPGVASAKITLSNWDLAHHYLKPGLILEAVHQFSVRLATAVSKNTDESYRYLPVMVEQFTSVADFEGDTLTVEGDIERINNGACRIYCKARSDVDPTAVIARAVILVSKVYLPESTSVKPFFLVPGALCQVVMLTHDFHTFRFDARHPLFAEHFPCRAVCPGSLLLDIVINTVGRACAKEIALIEFEKVKFIEAVHPDNDYHLTLQRDKGNDSNGVFYIHTEPKKRFTCGKFSVKYKESGAVCLTL